MLHEDGSVKQEFFKPKKVHAASGASSAHICGLLPDPSVRAYVCHRLCWWMTKSGAIKSGTFCTRWASCSLIATWLMFKEGHVCSWNLQLVDGLTAKRQMPHAPGVGTLWRGQVGGDQRGAAAALGRPGPAGKSSPPLGLSIARALHRLEGHQVLLCPARRCHRNTSCTSGVSSLMYHAGCMHVCWTEVVRSECHNGCCVSAATSSTGSLRPATTCKAQGTRNNMQE